LGKKTLATALTESLGGRRFINRQESTKNGKIYTITGFHGMETLYARVIYVDGQMDSYTLSSMINDTPIKQKTS